MDDELARLAALTLLTLTFLLLLLGGLRTRVGGPWRDGERQLFLRQLGPYVRGHAKVAGGLQIFRGFALFGRVVLWRYDYGARHLRALGFNERQVDRLEGQITGMFRLHWHAATADVLTGTFSGKRFAFSGERSAGSNYVQPEQRRLRRGA